MQKKNPRKDGAIPVKDDKNQYFEGTLPAGDRQAPPQAVTVVAASGDADRVGPNLSTNVLYVTCDECGDIFRATETYHPVPHGCVR